MLATLIRRELLDNLMTFRFAAAVFITLLLVIANTAVLIKDYERRLADYDTAVKTHQRQLQERKTYSTSQVILDRPPNPLSILNVGFDKQLGNQIEIYHGFIPTLWDAVKHGSDSSMMDIFSSIDIVFIFQVVLSLLALIFAHDALAGEHEHGTLRLVSDPFRPSWTYITRQIYQCNALSTGAINSEPALLNNFANDVHLNFPEYKRFSTNRGNCLCHRCLSVCVLPHRVADFDNDAPDEYRSNAVDVRVGIFGIGLSKCNSRRVCS